METMKALLLGSACAATLGAAVPALAQTPPVNPRATDVGEVIVTATRRSERLQDVPLSVTAYSQEALTAKGIVGYEGLAVETPGVVLNRPTANFNNFTARGIATNGYGMVGSDSLRQRYNAMVNVPLVQDKLAVRAVGFLRKEEGYVDNVGLANR